MLPCCRAAVLGLRNVTWPRELVAFSCVQPRFGGKSCRYCMEPASCPVGREEDGHQKVPCEYVKLQASVCGAEWRSILERTGPAERRHGGRGLCKGSIELLANGALRLDTSLQVTQQEVMVNSREVSLVPGAESAAFRDSFGPNPLLHAEKTAWPAKVATAQPPWCATPSPRPCAAGPGSGRCSSGRRCGIRSSRRGDSESRRAGGEWDAGRSRQSFGSLSFGPRESAHALDPENMEAHQMVR